jgi:hypothetical protein
MKYILICSLFLSASCARSRTDIVEITFYNGQKDTLRVEHNGDFFIYRGDLDAGCYQCAVASGVRTFQILKP